MSGRAGPFSIRNVLNATHGEIKRLRRRWIMGRQVSEFSTRTEGAEGCVVLVFSTDRDFLEHYRGVFLSLGFVPITAATVEAALAILRLMVVAFVVVDQSSGMEADRNILKRVQSAQPHALDRKSVV